MSKVFGWLSSGRDLGYSGLRSSGREGEKMLALLPLVIRLLQDASPNSPDWFLAKTISLLDTMGWSGGITATIVIAVAATFVYTFVGKKNN